MSAIKSFLIKNLIHIVCLKCAILLLLASIFMGNKSITITQVTGLFLVFLALSNYISIEFSKFKGTPVIPVQTLIPGCNEIIGIVILLACTLLGVYLGAFNLIIFDLNYFTII